MVALESLIGLWLASERTGRRDRAPANPDLGP